MSGNWLGSSGRTLEPLRLIRALNWKVHEHQGHGPQLSDLYINLQIPADAHVDMSNAYGKTFYGQIRQRLSYLATMSRGTLE